MELQERNYPVLYRNISLELQPRRNDSKDDTEASLDDKEASLDDKEAWM